MDTLLFAELHRIIQRLAPPIGPENNLGAVGLLLLELGNGFIDRIADLGEFVRDQAAIEVHRDNLRPELFVFRGFNRFYIHLVHVFLLFKISIRNS